MKKILTLTLALALAVAVFAQEKDCVFDPTNFAATITEMTPMRYASRQVTEFSFSIEGDTANVYLPYMGEVYTPRLDDEGLNFRAEYTDLKVKRNDRKCNTELRFNIRRGTITYKFQLTAFDRGNLDIYLQPSYAQACRYSGYWE